MSLMLDMVLSILALVGFLWVAFVVTPVLFAPNYVVMKKRWDATSIFNQILGFLVTLVTIAALIAMVVMGVVPESQVFKLFMIPPMLVTASFFIIYMRSRLK